MLWRIIPQRIVFDRRVRQRETRYACGMIEAEDLAQTVGSMIGHIQHADSLVARRRFFAQSLTLG